MEPARFFETHRGCRLFTRTRQLAHQMTAAAAQKCDRPPDPHVVSILINRQIARRSAVSHLSVNARREILVRGELAAASSQSKQSRERPRRMVQVVPPDERAHVHHAQSGTELR